MTFSTYENDVLTKLPLNIVGTCPPPVLFDRDSAERDILPNACYQGGFVLNTYLEEECSVLGEIRLEDAVPDQDYAENYARFAVEKLQEAVSQNQMLLDDLDQLFGELGDLPERSINELPKLEVREFLEKLLSRRCEEATPSGRNCSDPQSSFYCGGETKKIWFPQTNICQSLSRSHDTENKRYGNQRGTSCLAAKDTSRSPH